jgi:hypothetical protein
MEDVLDLYEAAPDPKRPRLGFDERPCQLIGQIVAPLPMKPGRVKREDNEYKRNGTAVVLLAYDLDSGRRFVEVCKRRTKADYADFMYRLVKEHYANVKQIRLVQDNLNTQLRLILRAFRGGGGALAQEQDRVSFYAQAWVVAQHGGIGAFGAESSVLGSPHREQGGVGARGQGVGAAAQRAGCEAVVVIHDNDGAGETEAPLRQSQA